MTRKIVAQFSVLIYAVDRTQATCGSPRKIYARRYETVIVDVNTEEEVYATLYTNPVLKLRSACRHAGDIIASWVAPRLYEERSEI